MTTETTGEPVKVTAEMTAAAAVILARFGLKGFKEAGGEETRRFETKLTLDGRAVAIISNGGTGGGNQNDFLDRDLDKRRADEDLVDALAAEWCKLTGDDIGDTLESLVEKLIESREFSRAKARFAKKGFPVTLLVQDKPETLDFGDGRVHVHYRLTFLVGCREVEEGKQLTLKKNPTAIFTVI